MDQSLPSLSIGQTGVQDDLAAQRPFGLVRYYSITSLVIILLFAVLISSLVTQRTSELVLAKREQYALLLGENLNHQVMVRFVGPILEKYGRINVGQPAQFELLDAVVRNTIHSFQVRQVNILDLEGTIIYSTEPDYIGRTGFEGPSFQVAVGGDHVSILDPAQDFFELTISKTRLMRTLLPLRDERRLTSEFGPPRAVFEITLDVSEDFREVWLNQVLIVATLLGMMALLFIILRSLVKRGQAIVDQRTRRQIMLEEKLSQAERLAALGRMVAGVAHEIRNPLGIVRSTAELLGKRVDPEQRPLAQVIVEESSRLNRVVTEFLDFARPQNPQLRPMRVEEVLQRNLKALEPELERGKVQLNKSLANQRQIMGDPDLLYRAFLNIFNNALQAMGEQGGLIRVSTQDVERGGRQWVAVRVTDNGPGLSPQAAGRIFDPFFTTKEQGTGLGLSIVNSIVASHLGEVEISPAPQGGTLVEVLLPVVQEDAWSAY